MQRTFTIEIDLENGNFSAKKNILVPDWNKFILPAK
jgi:hypothetical protein